MKQYFLISVMICSFISCSRLPVENKRHRTIASSRLNKCYSAIQKFLITPTKNIFKKESSFDDSFHELGSGYVLRALRGKKSKSVVETKVLQLIENVLSDYDQPTHDDIFQTIKRRLTRRESRHFYDSFLNKELYAERSSMLSEDASQGNPLAKLLLGMSSDLEREQMTAVILELKKAHPNASKKELESLLIKSLVSCRNQ